MAEKSEGLIGQCISPLCQIECHKISISNIFLVKIMLMINKPPRRMQRTNMELLSNFTFLHFLLSYRSGRMIHPDDGITVKKTYIILKNV